MTKLELPETCFSITPDYCEAHGNDCSRGELSVDLRTGKMTQYEVSTHDTGATQDEWYGLVSGVSFPALPLDAVEELAGHAAPLFQRLIDLCDEQWDGHRFVNATRHTDAVADVHGSLQALAAEYEDAHAQYVYSRGQADLDEADAAADALVAAFNAEPVAGFSAVNGGESIVLFHDEFGQVDVDADLVICGPYSSPDATALRAGFAEAVADLPEWLRWKRWETS